MSLLSYHGIQYSNNIMQIVIIMFQFGGLVSKTAASDDGVATMSSVKAQVEASGRSYQMPIVVRDSSRRGGKLQPQDASTVDIHLPSKLSKYPKGTCRWSEISLVPGGRGTFSLSLSLSSLFV